MEQVIIGVVVFLVGTYSQKGIDYIYKKFFKK